MDFYDDECPISLNKIKNNFKLKCNHNFEFMNIYKWYKKNNKCPLCRDEIDESTFESFDNKLSVFFIDFRITISDLMCYMRDLSNNNAIHIDEHYSAFTDFYYNVISESIVYRLKCNNHIDDNCEIIYNKCNMINEDTLEIFYGEKILINKKPFIMRHKTIHVFLDDDVIILFNMINQYMIFFLQQENAYYTLFMKTIKDFESEIYNDLMPFFDIKLNEEDDNGENDYISDYDDLDDDMIPQIHDDNDLSDNDINLIIPFIHNTDVIRMNNDDMMNNIIIQIHDENVDNMAINNDIDFDLTDVFFLQ